MLLKTILLPLILLSGLILFSLYRSHKKRKRRYSYLTNIQKDNKLLKKKIEEVKRGNFMIESYLVNREENYLKEIMDYFDKIKDERFERECDFKYNFEYQEAVKNKMDNVVLKMFLGELKEGTKLYRKYIREVEKQIVGFDTILDYDNNYSSDPKEKGVQFERECVEVLLKNSWQVDWRGERLGKADGGIDIVAYKGNRTVLIQCKNYKANAEITDKNLRVFYGDIKLYEQKENIDTEELYSFFVTKHYQLSYSGKKWLEESGEINYMDFEGFCSVFVDH